MEKKKPALLKKGDILYSKKRDQFVLIVKSATDETPAVYTPFLRKAYRSAEAVVHLGQHLTVAQYCRACCIEASSPCSLTLRAYNNEGKSALKGSNKLVEHENIQLPSKEVKRLLRAWHAARFKQAWKLFMAR